MMLLETMDLQARKVVCSFNLADERNRPRRTTGLTVDPAGKYLYTTMMVVVVDRNLRSEDERLLVPNASDL